MDGYAVRLADFASAAGGEVELEVLGESKAGAPFEGPIGDGQSVAIYTGAEAPADCDAVVMVEKTRREAHPDLQQERLQYERDAIRWRKNRDKANRDSKNAREKAERDAARREIEERHAARDAFLAGANAPPPPPDPFLVDALEDARRDAQFPEKAARRRAQKCAGLCSRHDVCARVFVIWRG